VVFVDGHSKGEGVRWVVGCGGGDVDDRLVAGWGFVADAQSGAL
jgi:hypothetical protein